MNKWFGKLHLHLISGLALVFGGLYAFPASASVSENCVGSDCSVTFSFSGQMDTFNPPKNATNLTFEIFGAQGGRSGGGGGKVTGTIDQIPDVLYIFVGGAGRSGDSATGGFNGGGNAGAGSDSQGSGGGATDIRSGLELSSRIVVAGGGGSKGAGLGSGGGSGGGLIGLAGRTAQGIGGAGGSQQAGGIGGAPNGTGTAGTAGSLGLGGTGGSSSLFGGGGGGGGYFGGGGGGSDTDPCCSDAGGGGGGSSYADDSLVSNVVHSQGVWSGSGKVIFQYQLAPMVTSMTPVVSGEQVSFQVEFSESVTGFDISDLEILHSGGSCSGVSLTGSGQSYQLLLSECDDGEVVVVVNPDSVIGSAALGPLGLHLSGLVVIDTVSPEASWAQSAYSGGSIEFSEPIEGLDLSAFDFSSSSDDCHLSDLRQLSAAIWRVTTIGCEQSNHTISLRSQSVSDATGNLGPTSSVSTSFIAEVSEPPAPDLPTPEPSTPESEPLPTEEPEAPVATESDSSETDETAGNPSDSVSDEQSEPPREIPESSLPGSGHQAPTDSPEQIPDAPDLPSGSIESPDQGAATLEPRGLVKTRESDSTKEHLSTGVFISPPASSLPQASQTLVSPSQSTSSEFGSNGLSFGLMAIALFALGAGLVVARRGIPGVLTS
jgi:hypothetical protein